VSWPFDPSQDMLSPLAFLLALLSLVFASCNCFYFGSYAAGAATKGRAVAAVALALLSAALAAEATLFISLFQPGPTLSGTALIAVVSVRGVLLAAVAFLSLLALRGRRGRQG